MRDRLRVLGEDVRRRWSDEATSLLETLPELRDAQHLLLFRSLPSEIDTGALLAGALARGREVWCPRIEGPAVSFRRVREGISWRVGVFGTLEPDATEALPAAGFPAGRAVVVVPGVAFSPRGDRLGRGGGHYDRALGSPPLLGSARSIGFAFDLQIVDEIPVEPHDVRVDVVVTEKRILRAR